MDREVDCMKDFIYAFVGEDEFLIENEIEKLIKKLKVDPFNVLSYDLEEQELFDFFQEITTVSLLSDRKIIKVKNAWFFYEERDEDLGPLLRYFSDPKTDTAIVFILTEEPNRALPVSKEAYKYARFETIKPMSANEFLPYIKNYLQSKNYKITNDALKELVERVNYDFHTLYNEVEKLKLYAYDNKTITLRDVQLLVPRNLEDNFFELTNAIIAKNKRRMLEIYYDLLTKNEQPVRIINFISRALKEVITTKQLLNQGFNQASIQEYFNVSSGKAYYMVKNARATKDETLKKHYDTLAELDFKIKSGVVEPKLGLELWLLGG